MKLPLPPEIEFHEDIRLFIYRPRGLLNEASVDRAVSVLGELETKLKEPFNRFSDASAIDRLYFQLHAIITKDSPINVRIFRQREEAAQWLGVPLERLAGSADGEQSNKE
jgi:hypothetical protein